ncbi:MAG TPA: hypothetical protein VF546_18290 [Pyrinomonadaceae bacterium]|jgi:hypothetical protein
MGKKKKAADANEHEPPTPAEPAPMTKRRPAIFARRNRGLLLDLVLFAANLFLLRLLTRSLLDFFGQASAKENLTKMVVGLLALALWLLPALGAVLKRWHFHRRLREQGRGGPRETALAGCLFNPIFYFCLNLVLVAIILTSLGDALFGKALLDRPGVFVPLVFVGLVLTIIQTYLIYRYFAPPARAPRSAFLRTSQSETLGDVCIFLYMILFQVTWNLLAFVPLGPATGWGEFAFRVFFLGFTALLVYFPPRVFYLAEDINRPRTWLFMLLANAPVILRILFGSTPAAPGH